MGYSVKPSDLAETGGEVHANKVVIVTGPSLGTGLKLIVFGAALGAAAALYWKNMQESEVSAAEDIDSAHSARWHILAERAKALGSRVSDTIHSAAELAPAIKSALQEAKQVAHDVETEIKDELRDLKEDSKESKPEQV